MNDKDSEKAEETYLTAKGAGQQDPEVGTRHQSRQPLEAALAASAHVLIEDVNNKESRKII